MLEYEAEILFRPGQPELAYLPEGPQPCGPHQISWVAIQHGQEATFGSFNILDIRKKVNRSYPLEGRPGFALPTADSKVFVMGIEKLVGFYNLRSKKWLHPPLEVEPNVKRTIINDGLARGNYLIFGTKDLAFKAPKANLYFLRLDRMQLKLLKSGQTCSNGKAIIQRNGKAFLLDIDTPTRKVVEYPLDEVKGTIGPAKVTLDLTSLDSFPDGMVLAPDRPSVIIAMYHPGQPLHGEARMHSLATGELEAIWKTHLSPRVTCPQLVDIGGRVKLVLTTAIEQMSRKQKLRYPNAGCIFVADTPFDKLRERRPIKIPVALK